ncbi:MAG: hypothetical protein MUF81_15800 [Verrucomicrobia bacterium]|nr:hypothetical protein [Verrucomicrobiota bacterium]
MNLAGVVFAVVILWKALLLITTAQPVPFSDSFFYDGPVVNLLNGGAYANPALELVLPISATKVFSAYPPLYQSVLWIWMSLFGPSALAAMWLHLILFAIYGLGLIAIFHHLQLPAVFVNLGCLFLFGVTYHDRPDSLAFALGIWAIYAWLRAMEKPAASTRTWWHWGAAGLNLLTLTTSLQLGMLFLGWAALLVISLSWMRRQLLPQFALATAVMIPSLLGLYVKTMQPEIWAGFQEHLHETPSLLVCTPQLIKPCCYPKYSNWDVIPRRYFLRRSVLASCSFTPGTNGGNGLNPQALFFCWGQWRWRDCLLWPQQSF